ncbi:unnamed protein product [Heligmosomoides polygyrus]|uniref:DUF5641 domain-containing protein n=1 Tax=Heligmosomoides polygyrus TaxID=6339 RepID=A0A183F9H8_HELPZ|nr:unnamed protein product [Heligmosomoides polygyrus]
MWRIGRIVGIRSNPLDKVREVVIELPNKSRIRRPVNKVVPLEIDDKPTPPPEDGSSTPVYSPPTPVSALPPQHPYNLRVRKPINYNEREENDVRDESDKEDELEDRANQPSFSTPHSSLNLIRHVPLFLTLLLLLLTGTNATKEFNESHHL